MNSEVDLTAGTLKGAWRDYLARIKSGEIGRAHV